MVSFTGTQVPSAEAVSSAGNVDVGTGGRGDRRTARRPGEGGVSYGNVRGFSRGTTACKFHCGKEFLCGKDEKKRRRPDSNRRITDLQSDPTATARTTQPKRWPMVAGTHQQHRRPMVPSSPQVPRSRGTSPFIKQKLPTRCSALGKASQFRPITNFGGLGDRTSAAKSHSPRGSERRKGRRGRLNW